MLPDAFAQNAERLARFQREAEILASLNHPNIAAIYGVEKSGGVQALVMELVEGEDRRAELVGRAEAAGARELSAFTAGRLEACAMSASSDR